jgi:DNA-directed RNA polymerase specialized sigma24 family protein
MAQDEEKPTNAKRKSRRDGFRNVPLRERLGKKRDIAIGLLRWANFGKPISDADTLAQQRVSYQPDITEPPEPEPQVNSSRRFKRFWASLTHLQKEAMRRVYLKNPERLPKVEIAHLLGIRPDTLQERLDHAIKKLRRFFPELGQSRGKAEAVDKSEDVAEHDRD